MLDVSVSGKQRLRELENTIRNNFEAWVNTGFALIEIRDNHLYKHAGYKTWMEYQKKRLDLEFGIGRSQAYNVIQASIVRSKIKPDFQKSGNSEKNDWNINAALELARLAPKKSNKVGEPRDVRALSKADVNFVAKAATQEAKRLNKPITAPIVRKCVDAALNIDRAKQAAETKRKKEESRHRDIKYVMVDYIGTIKSMINQFSDVPDDAWGYLEEDAPGNIQQLAEACEKLSTMMRSKL